LASYYYKLNSELIRSIHNFQEDSIVWWVETTIKGRTGKYWNRIYSLLEIGSYSSMCRTTNLTLAIRYYSPCKPVHRLLFCQLMNQLRLPRKILRIEMIVKNIIPPPWTIFCFSLMKVVVQNLASKDYFFANLWTITNNFITLMCNMSMHQMKFCKMKTCKTI
jgi:hypothetical protein